jgi:HAE1 family hydrophobic/amphiphilic exporter-1
VFREEGDEYNVTVRLRESDRKKLADIGQVGIATPLGRIVPLRNLVRFEAGESPLQIDRLDRQRVAIVTAGTEGRDLGGIVAELEQKLAAVPVPEGFTIDIGGDWEEQQRSFRALQGGFLLAVLLMYVIMAAQFESLRDPLLILLTLPLGAIGVLLVFVFWQTTLNVQSFIGIVVLSGIVVNNAIVLVDYVNQLRRREPGADMRWLIERASVRRLRPILMTTLTTVLGMFPVALGHGDGGELQAPLARVIVGGLLSGTLMTLVAIPVVYWYVSRPAAEPASSGHADDQELAGATRRELVQA